MYRTNNNYYINRLNLFSNTIACKNDNFYEQGVRRVVRGVLLYLFINKRDSHYATLDVQKNATSKEIKQAYYKLSKQYHPDVNKESHAEEKFKKIQEAYHVLGDVNKKYDYDLSLDVGISGSGGGSFYQQSSTVNNQYQKDEQNGPSYVRWKARSSKMHTGKTAQYDFDEYYKMHYGDMLRKRQAEIRYEEQMRMRWEEAFEKRKKERENYARAYYQSAYTSATSSNSNDNNLSFKTLKSLNLFTKYFLYYFLITFIIASLYMDESNRSADRKDLLKEKGDNK